MLISVSRRDRYQRSFNDYSRLDRFVTRLACTTVRCSIVLPWCNDVEIRTDRLTTDPWKSFDPIGHGPCVWKPLHEIPRSFVTSGNRVKHNAFCTHLLVSSHSISYTLVLPCFTSFLAVNWRISSIVLPKDKRKNEEENE